MKTKLSNPVPLQNEKVYIKCSLSEIKTQRELLFKLALGKGSPLRSFFKKSLESIININENKNSFYYIRIDNNYAILLESLSKKRGKKHQFESDFIFTHDGVFNDEGNVVFCLQIALRKISAKKLYRNIFQLNEHDRQILDYRQQFRAPKNMAIIGCYLNSLEIQIENSLEDKRYGTENSSLIKFLDNFDLTLDDCANIENIKDGYFHLNKY